MVRPSSARRRDAIVDAATALFLEQGYRGTSMDGVASSAGVSKQTLYKQFSDKAHLFHHVVESLMAGANQPLEEAIAQLDANGDLASELLHIARLQTALVLDAQLLQLRRLVVAETDRFPELGRAFFDQGPRRTVDELATALARSAELGRLRIGDAGVAAAHFMWLVLGPPLNQALLLGGQPPDPTDVDWAAVAVDTFMAAFARA